MARGPKLEAAIATALGLELIKNDSNIDRLLSFKKENSYILCNSKGEELATISLEMITSFVKAENSIEEELSEIDLLYQKRSGDDESVYTPLEEAYIRRLRDKKGGYAVAHLIPFVGIYYAISRRTITPYLWVKIPQVILFGLLYLTNSTGSAQQLWWIIAVPMLANNGIGKSRRYARQKLLNRNNTKGELNHRQAILKKRFSRQLEKLSTLSREASSILLIFTRRLYKNGTSLIQRINSPKEIRVSKLEELKSLYEKGLISEKDYEALRRKELGT